MGCACASFACVGDAWHGGHDGQKVREKKYGHLNAAAKAKQERECPRTRGSSVSSRYSSDPIKFTKDKEDLEWGHNSTDSVFTNHSRYNPDSDSHKMPYGFDPAMMLPVDKDDYLEPGAAAASLAYLDLEGSGYYQNEKIQPDGEIPLCGDTDEMMSSSGPQSPSRALLLGDDPRHAYRNQPSPPIVPAGFSVANPDYFDDDSEIWKPKNQMRNGYHPIPNTSTSPIHKVSDQDADHPYYRSMNGGLRSNGVHNGSPRVNTSVRLHPVRLDSAESKI